MISLKDRLVCGGRFTWKKEGEEERRGEGRGVRGEGNREGELSGRKNLVWKEEVVDEAN